MKMMIASPERVEVIKWFCARGLKPISHFDVCYWRPELLDTFIEMTESEMLDRHKQPKHEYVLTSKTLQLVADVKSGRLK